MAKMGYEGRTVVFDWHNKRPEAFGYKFKSKQEYRWAQYLEFQKMGQTIIKWQYEPKRFDAKKIRYRILRQYTPDFRIETEIWDSPKSCRVYHEWHEVKTSLTQKDVTRFRWFKEDYPEERIILVLNSKPLKGKSKIMLDKIWYTPEAKGSKKIVDDVIFAGPILRKLGI